VAEEEAPLEGVPTLALRRERAPNGDGAKLLGYSTDFAAAVKAAATASLVVIVDIELTDAEATQVGGAAAVVVLGTLQGMELAAAQVILPITNVAEENGTFVNRDLRVQRYSQARTAPGMARPAWWVCAEAAPGSAPATAADAFALACGQIPALAGMSYKELGLNGMIVPARALAAVGGA
jgi:predicted molibdopterin-dependent oxidoreductase YjgC